MIVAAQCRAARGLLDWSRDRLATAAGLDPDDVRAFERGEPQPGDRIAAAIRDAFVAAGVEFLDGATPGVRMKPASDYIAPDDLSAANDD